MINEDKITYIEFVSTDATVTKDFYETVFGWTFTDWGTEYFSFEGAGIEGGFDLSGERSPSNGTLVIVSTSKLEEKYDTVVAAGGKITKDIFSFPGGRRFEFLDPSGNGLAVWQAI